MVRKSLLPLIFPLTAMAAFPASQPSSAPSGDLQTAQSQYDAAVGAAVEAFRGSNEYRAAEQKVRDTENSLDSARTAADLSPDAITAAAGDSLDSRAALQRMEADAVEADPRVTAARAKLAATRAKLAAPPATRPAAVAK